MLAYSYLSYSFVANVRTLECTDHLVNRWSGGGVQGWEIPYGNKEFHHFFFFLGRQIYNVYVEPEQGYNPAKFERSCFLRHLPLTSPHISLNPACCWGTTDDFTTSFLHFFPCSPLPSWTWQSEGLSMEPVLPSQLFLCLPCTCRETVCVTTSTTLILTLSNVWKKWYLQDSYHDFVSICATEVLKKPK